MLNESYWASHARLINPKINTFPRHTNPQDPKDRKNISYRLDYGLRS